MSSSQSILSRRLRLGRIGFNSAYILNPVSLNCFKVDERSGQKGMVDG